MNDALQRRSCIYLLSLLLLLKGASLTHAADLTFLPLGPAAPHVVLWQADLSQPDRPLADARLDHPVKFWRTAILMDEVFTEIQRQTGVEIHCWPADDVNRRIRVNLYLNPTAPPSLRDLLAQLAWVLDCNFACTPEEPRTYYLLSTTLGQGMAERILANLIKEIEAQSQTELQDMVNAEVRAEQARMETLDRLEKQKAALALSQDELIAQYYNVDNNLLLVLLDPCRRAALQFTLLFSLDDLAMLIERGELSRPLSQLSPAQQALVPIMFRRDDIPKESNIRCFAHEQSIALLAEHPQLENQETVYTQAMRSPYDTMDIPIQVTLQRSMGKRISEEDEKHLLEEEAQRERNKDDA